MTVSHELEWAVLGLLAAVVALLVLAQRSRIPYPILFVLGGLALGFVPGLPEYELAPELVLLIALPPLLYSAAFFSSLRDLRANVRSISLLAVGLVLATTVGVAWVAHTVVGLPWDVAFVLGAIVSPTDPIAATAIAARAALPRRIVTIIEGESLVNDGTGLVAYRVAIAAAVGEGFSLLHAFGQFLLSSLGGVAIGLAVGFVVAWVRRRVDDPPTETAISIVTGYLAYLPAEALGVSGVLATVTVGSYLGWLAPRLASRDVRMQTTAVWEALVFALNGFLFILVGLQLPFIVDRLGARDWQELLVDAAAVAGAVMVIRLVWIFPNAYLPRLVWPALRRRDPYPPWQAPVVIGWTGMRGAVSLAAALAIPLTTDAGAPFPERDLIIFLTFTTILATLVIQGLSLPALIARLRVPDDGSAAYEENKARLLAAEAAIARLDELSAESWVRDDTAERLRGAYDYRRRRFRARFDDGDDGGYEARTASFTRLRRALLDAEREELLRLRAEGRIGDDVMRRVERDIDLEDGRFAE